MIDLPAGDVQRAQVLGGVERALYELRQPRVVLGLGRRLEDVADDAALLAVPQRDPWAAAAAAAAIRISRQTRRGPLCDGAPVVVTSPVVILRIT